MTGKIKEYLGPNKAVCDVGGKNVTVRIPVNVAHPAVGEKLDFKASAVVDAPKAEKPAKAPKAEKPAEPVKVTERGPITPEPEK